MPFVRAWEINTVRSVLVAVHDLGLSFDFVAAPQVETGGLASAPTQVFVLPLAACTLAVSVWRHLREHGR